MIFLTHREMTSGANCGTLTIDGAVSGMLLNYGKATPLVPNLYGATVNSNRPLPHRHRRCHDAGTQTITAPNAETKRFYRVVAVALYTSVIRLGRRLTE